LIHIHYEVELTPEEEEKIMEFSSSSNANELKKQISGIFGRHIKNVS